MRVGFVLSGGTARESPPPLRAPTARARVTPPPEPPPAPPCSAIYEHAAPSGSRGAAARPRRGDASGLASASASSARLSRAASAPSAPAAGAHAAFLKPSSIVLPASTAVRGGFSFAAAAAGVAASAASAGSGLSAADAAAAARKAAVLARKAEMMAEAGDASDREDEGAGAGMHAAGMLASPGGVGGFAASSGAALQTPSPQAPAAAFGARGPSASRAGKKARIEPTTVAQQHAHAPPTAAATSPSGAAWAPAGASSVALDVGDAKWATHVWGSAAAAKGGSFAEAVLGRKAAAPASTASGSSAMETGADADEAAVAAAEGHAAVEEQGEEDDGGFITVSAAGASKGECSGQRLGCKGGGAGWRKARRL